MAFWTNYIAGSESPKRNFRFRVTIGDASSGFADGGSWYAKKATKPSFSITDSTHAFLNHNFYYPGRLEWNTVSITFVDPVSPDAASTLSAMIAGAGYRVPLESASGTGGIASWTTITKSSMQEALGSIIIEQLDQVGNPVETWTLNQAWIKDVKFSELSYESEDLSEITVELRYDWASLETKNGSANAVKGGGGTIAKGTKTFFGA